MDNRKNNIINTEKSSEDFFAKQEDLYQKGKKIVTVIMVVSIVSSVLSFFTNFSRIFSSIISIGLAVSLYAGVSFVRWIYVVFSVINCVIDIMGVVGVVSLSLHPVLRWIIAILLIADAVYNIICFNLLTRSKSVSEFLYSQKNG